MEGAYGMMHLGSPEKVDAAHRQVEEYSIRLRVCSLSRESGDHLLWAYYASGFSGMAIEVEIPEPATYDPRIEEGPVRVKQVECERGPHLGTLPYDDPKSAAYERLAFKQRHWAHEKEVRIIADTEALEAGCFYKLPSRPTAVCVGMRMPSASQIALAIVCSKLEIPFAKVSPMNSEPPSLEFAFAGEVRWQGGSAKLPKSQHS
jgi:hypothetical protein